MTPSENQWVLTLALAAPSQARALPFALLPHRFALGLHGTSRKG